MNASPPTTDMRPAAATEIERAPALAPGGGNGNGADMARVGEPRRRADSVADLHSFLEQRSRQWSSVLRLLEQQRVQIQTVETERDGEYQKLAAAVEAAEQAMRAVRAATDLSKDARPAAEIEKIIEHNRVTLDQLETVAANLNTRFLAWRSAWAQYAQTYDTSKRMRADMESRIPNRT
jgi:chromosome segregation ATPase